MAAKRATGFGSSSSHTGLRWRGSTVSAVLSLVVSRLVDGVASELHVG